MGFKKLFVAAAVVMAAVFANYAHAEEVPTADSQEARLNNLRERTAALRARRVAQTQPAPAGARRAAGQDARKFAVGQANVNRAGTQTAAARRRAAAPGAGTGTGGANLAEYLKKSELEGALGASGFAGNVNQKLTDISTEIAGLERRIDDLTVEAGGMTPAETQSMIDASISGFVDQNTLNTTVDTAVSAAVNTARTQLLSEINDSYALKFELTQLRTELLEAIEAIGPGGGLGPPSVPSTGDNLWLFNGASGNWKEINITGNVFTP
ncbi:MAG: hypothetical protein FWD15_03150 [Alphaproteobacteria bacterium]|nr:hypothetical protein [Alphaproteobacteria bacterium]